MRPHDPSLNDPYMILHDHVHRFLHFSVDHRLYMFYARARVCVIKTSSDAKYHARCRRFMFNELVLPFFKPETL